MCFQSCYPYTQGEQEYDYIKRKDSYFSFELYSILKNDHVLHKHQTLVINMIPYQTQCHKYFSVLPAHMTTNRSKHQHFVRHPVFEETSRPSSQQISFNIWAWASTNNNGLLPILRLKHNVPFLNLFLQTISPHLCGLKQTLNEGLHGTLLDLRSANTEKNKLALMLNA